MNPVALDKFFATPALWYPGQTQEEWELECALMLERSRLTHDFVDGKVSPSEFMDGLHDLGVDVIQSAEDWEDGLVYL